MCVSSGQMHLFAFGDFSELSSWLPQSCKHVLTWRCKAEPLHGGQEPGGREHSLDVQYTLNKI